MSNSSLRSIAAAVVSISALFLGQPAFADWHTGKVSGIHIGYDGSTIMFSLSGWSRTNCTCYSTWPTYMCLTRSATRLASKEEFALLLKARASDDSVAVNINETTCSVEALSEGT
jgi:hypothetical protein